MSIFNSYFDNFIVLCVDHELIFEINFYTGNYAKANRPGVVRNVVKASIPILVPSGDSKAQDSAAFIIRNTFQKALGKGEFEDFQQQ